MESFGPWKFIKSGFWIGIGFIIPSIGVYILGTYVVYSMPYLWQSVTANTENAAMEQFMSDSDKTGQIHIGDVREVSNGSQLLILGTIENIGESPVGSIRLEAELLDDSDKMVFECSEYISRKLKNGDTENFQIKCGCGDTPAPEHASINVRVVQANSF